MRHSFASDNYAGMHPEVLARLASVNEGHEISYGDDTVTEQLRGVMRSHFGEEASVYPVFNGTGANVVSLQAMTKSWEAVVCADYAHINNDEGGAPEKMAGLKLLTVQTTDAKLVPDDLAQFAPLIGDEHRAQPKVVSITQSTELGTVYSPSEVSALTKSAHDLGLLVHMDGARLSNAAAALGVPLRDFTTDAGVDVLSLGATKIGAMGAEAVVVLNSELDSSIKFIRKTSMQLPSKMRFISAQILALFEGDLYLRNAVHANSLALKLYEAIAGIPGITVERPQANALFPVLPPEVTAKLQEKFRFYVWNHKTGQVRWMTSWDSTESDIEEFAAAIKVALA